MREIDDAREALNRVENNLERYRWILRNPRKARDLLTSYLDLNDFPDGRRDDRAATMFAQRIDEERATEQAKILHSSALAEASLRRHA